MATKLRTSAVAAELLGTFILALVVLTVSKSSLNLPFFVSLSAGLAVAGAMLLFARSPGVHLNPAVTVGLLSLKQITILKAFAYIAAQLIGGFAAYNLFAYFSGQRWHNTGHFEVKLFVAEVFGTCLFSMGWAAAVSRNRETARSSAVIGLSFFLALLATSSAGTVMLNPAVALGLRTWVWGSSVLGPLVGAGVGFTAYKFLFASETAPLIEPVPGKSPVRTVGTHPSAAKRLR